MVPIRVNDVVANLSDLLRHAVGNGIEVFFELDPRVEYALCDSNQLENALLNLALNARDSMPQGGRLSVSTSFASAANAPDLDPGDYVELKVADSGHGMPPEVLARATEPFFSTKATGKGTGLGLAQVYGIARQSGGTLRIESRPGEGTMVAILLPRAEGAETG